MTQIATQMLKVSFENLIKLYPQSLCARWPESHLGWMKLSFGQSYIKCPLSVIFRQGPLYPLQYGGCHVLCTCISIQPWVSLNTFYLDHCACVSVCPILDADTCDTCKSDSRGMKWHGSTIDGECTCKFELPYFICFIYLFSVQ